MKLNLFTLSCLVLTITLQKEASGKVKMAPNSQHLNIIEYEDQNTAENPFAAIRKCKVNEDICDITDFFPIDAVLSFYFNDTKIDHFVYQAEIKFEGYEKSLNTRVRTAADSGMLMILHNNALPESRVIRTSLKGLEVPKQKNGTLTFSVQGVDEKGKVVSLWSIIADVEVEKEVEEDDTQFEED